MKKKLKNQPSLFAPINTPVKRARVKKASAKKDAEEVLAPFTKRHNKAKYVIGVDCGRNTGVAVYDLEKQQFVKILTFTAVSFLDALYRLPFFQQAKSNLFFVVEDTNLNKPVFPAKIAKLKFQSEASKMMQVASLGTRIGRNQEATYIIINILKLLGFNLSGIKPQSHKWDAEYLSLKFPDILQSTNEHNRDAIKLVAEYENLC